MTEFDKDELLMKVMEARNAILTPIAEEDFRRIYGRFSTVELVEFLNEFTGVRSRE